MRTSVLKAEKQYLQPRPRKGASAGFCSLRPLAGLERSRLGLAPPFLCATPGRSSLSFSVLTPSVVVSPARVRRIMSTRTIQTTWFLQVNSQVCGPLLFAELRELVRSKVATSDSLVSRDGRTWHRIAETPELQGQATSVLRDASQSAAGTGSPASHVATLAWIATGVLGGAGLLTCGIVVLLAFASEQSAPPGTSAATARSSSGMTNPLAETTSQYWMNLKQIAASPPQPGRDELAQLTTMVSQIEGLPVVNVDSDVVVFAYELSALLRAAVENARRQGEITHFVETLLRGISGDFFGPLNDQLQTNNALQSQLQALEQHEKRLRAVLSQRYGFEFPPL